MLYLLSKEFTKISTTTGTVQNASKICTLEMSNTNTPDSGILIYLLQKVSFVNKTIYLRCVDGWAKARVVDFIINAGGIITSSSSSDTQGGGGSSDPTNLNAQYLIVDSPFTTDLTDNCGVVWTPNGTVIVSDGAAQFQSSYLSSASQITFGGDKDFTIAFYIKARADHLSDFFDAAYENYGKIIIILYNNSFMFDVSNADSTYIANSIAFANGAVDDNWYHI